ncbi:MAG: DUF2268 domain-containing putative Zn-dependent protease [Paracoccus sp. (in: a-proteobacteria)]|uniref:DUF2268 domain-containing putative Zn-dependent protease n=1 Tax=Paracoccus sp. TaxID=267 RepID=UPI0026DF23EA|nr:DUF2268 domain-containing putative Zn-dependent protease [Paracoccus sp. (in: a-proteobacteria)]MDO5631190.1 DUF2268 domain-containing putative Zn-dependent protease [Paracoccus sp. (in: a-proteobacteria)]
MTTFYLHPLNARHALTPVLSEIRAGARHAVAMASELTEVPDFDLVVRAEPGGGITDWGVSGYAPAPGLVEIVLDPARYDAQALIRTLLHEMHHIIRWAGPGYGRSLGETLVSEGLAGHFVVQVLGGQPDPWDRTAPSSGLARRAQNEWSRLDFSYAEWFQGKGGLRKWAGYGLGHRLIAEYLTQAPDQTAALLAQTGAETFRAAMRRLVTAEGAAPDDAPDHAQG